MGSNLITQTQWGVSRNPWCGVHRAGTCMYKFLSIFEAHSIGYSGFMVQSTEDAEYIISSIFVFQTFCPALAEASSLLKNILK